MESVPEGYKRCSGDPEWSCGEVKPSDEEHFYRKGNGWQSLCRDCFNKRRKALYQANKERELEQAKEWQRTHPDARREIDNRYRRHHGDELREKERESEAKPERRAVRKQYRDSHKDERQEYNDQYRDNHRDEIAAYNAQYRAENAEILPERQRQWREEHPEQDAAIHKKWKSSNKDTVNTNTNNRRARIRGLEGSYSVEYLQALYDSYDRTCLWCRRAEPEIRLEPDHIIAVTREGATNWITNIQPLCGGKTGCNYKKSNRNFDFRPFWLGEPPENPEFW